MQLKRLARTVGVTVSTCAAIGLSMGVGHAAQPPAAQAPCNPQSYCAWDLPNFAASNPKGAESGLSPGGYCNPALVPGGDRSAINYTSAPVTFWASPNCTGASYSVPAGGRSPDFGFAAHGIS